MPLSRLTVALAFLLPVACGTSVPAGDAGPLSDGSVSPLADGGVGRDDGPGTPGDSDGDGLSDELEGRFQPAPRDTDADGTPDYLDPDSDGDTIPDRVEGQLINGDDPDGDGVVDYLDLDSDGDGWLDREEAGDADLATAPADTDGDDLPDYLDVESDNDGLLDREERAAGTQRANPDSDGDGASDHVELRAETDPLDPRDNPALSGDLTFVLPSLGPARPSSATVRARTDLQRVDAYLLVDRTASMTQELAELSRGVAALFDRVACERSGVRCTSDAGCDRSERCGLDGVCMEDPARTRCIPSVFSGVGTYGSGTQSYMHLSSLQDDAMRTQAQIPSQTEGMGDEALYESLACVADRSLCPSAGCGTGGIGCPAFRRDARRVAVLVTDQPNDCPTSGPAPCRIINSASAAGDRLRRQSIASLGVDSSGSGSALLTGFDRTVLSSPTSLTDDIADGLHDVLRDVPMFVDLGVEPDGAADRIAVEAIERIEANTSAEQCGVRSALADTDGDGFDDAFADVTPGSDVCWDVVVRSGSRVDESVCGEQVFVADLTAFGDGAPLDRRLAIFVVPTSDEGCNNAPGFGECLCERE